MTKARCLAEQHERWGYELSLLLEEKERLCQRIMLAKARKENYAYKRELEMVNGEIALRNRFIRMTKIDLDLVIGSLVDRGLCTRSNYYEYLGVWRHEI
jgi:hypothetical protein